MLSVYLTLKLIKLLFFFTENNELEKEKEYSGDGFIHKVVRPLQKPGVELDTTWGIVKTLFIASDDKMPNVRKYYSLHNRAHRAQYSRFDKKHIYEASKVC